MASIDKNFGDKLSGNIPVGKNQRETERNLKEHLKKSGTKPNNAGIRKLSKKIHKET